MKNYLLRFLVIALALGLSVVALLTCDLRYGLDLAGGASLAYRIQAQVVDGVVEPVDVKKVIEILDKRVNAFGLSEITITATDDDEILIEVPGRSSDQLEGVKKLIQRNGDLEFRIVVPDSVLSTEMGKRAQLGEWYVPENPAWEWVPDGTPPDPKHPEVRRGPLEWLVLKPEKPVLAEIAQFEVGITPDYVARVRACIDTVKSAFGGTLVDPAAADPATAFALAEQANIGTARQVRTRLEEAVRSAPDGDARSRAREALDALATAITELEAPIAPKKVELARIEKAEVFRGKDLAKTRVQPGEGQLVVYFEMRLERQGDFTDFTTRHQHQRMAIILDGKVNSAPNIKSPLPGKGVIEGGAGGGFTQKEADELSIVLESGATGVKLELVREDQLGPSLGADAIETGKLSIVVGFVSVLLIMGWLYRVPGMIANLALLMNVLLMLGALAFFGAAMTLAGIAGIVLTLGMAVDANILIFERLREERARGKSLVEALAAGYDRALVAIVDANVTTVLTALVLIFLGSGTVKGFGVTLTIGILASMFTAIYVTRAVFEWGVATGVMKRFGFSRDRRVPTLDYMRHRKWFTGPSIVLMVVGMVIFLARDEAASKDLEFVGGQQVVVQLDTPVTRPELLDVVGGDEWPGISAVRLTPRGVDVASSEQSNRWQVRVALDDRERGVAFVEHVRKTLGDRLVTSGITEFGTLPLAAGRFQADFTMHLLQSSATTNADTLRKDLEQYAPEGRDKPFANVVVTPAAEGAGGAFRVQLEGALQQTGDTSDPASDADADARFFVTDNVRLALQKAEEPVYLSDPMPSISFLNPGRAEELWRRALQAIVLSMALQVLYIRLRFADFTHGFAAVCALVHDVVIALGCVAAFDATELVYAKINLVLIAAFLTLIGYSMNDTIVVFDRIRENLGRSRVVRASVVNDSINQTLTRSIRTSLTTWIVVAIQFVLNRGSGSVLEGFAWVMVVGVISGSYSSIFIAGPLLLFLPGYWRKLSANRVRFTVQLITTVVGAIMAVTPHGHTPTVYIGFLLAANIPLHFFAHFIPWLPNQDPDSLLSDEIEAEDRARPLAKPGI